jgi:hypothetical protein
VTPSTLHRLNWFYFWLAHSVRNSAPQHVSRVAVRGDISVTARDSRSFGFRAHKYRPLQYSSSSPISHGNIITTISTTYHHHDASVSLIYSTCLLWMSRMYLSHKRYKQYHAMATVREPNKLHKHCHETKLGLILVSNYGRERGVPHKINEVFNIQRPPVLVVPGLVGGGRGLPTVVMVCLPRPAKVELKPSLLSPKSVSVCIYGDPGDWTVSSQEFGKAIL